MTRPISIGLVALIAATVTIASTSTVAAPTSDPNYAEALQKSMLFYEAQRAGHKDATNRVHWRGDSVLTDGSDVGIDLSGGWFDAGDHVKFGVPMAYSATMLAWGGLSFRDGYIKSGQMPYLKANLRFVADYFLQAHSKGKFYLVGQVGSGNADHSVWMSPEVLFFSAAGNRPTEYITKDCPGTELAGETSAALAAISLLLREDDPRYADTLLQHAAELHEFADTYRGVYTLCIPGAAGFYTSFSGYQDELAWAGAWMYKATGSSDYLSKARTAYIQSTGGAGCGCAWGMSWDDVSYGAAILLFEQTGDSLYSNNIEKNLNYWMNSIQKTPGGLSFLNQWGSLRYATTTAMTALAYSRLIAATKPTLAAQYSSWAKGQVDYALGKNPAGRSYVVGFGNNSPQNPHHRGATGAWGNSIDCCPSGSNRHVLVGALVGGPKAADDFAYDDVRGDYVANEVATDYNAGISGALAALADVYGGTPLSNFPQTESFSPSDEFGVRIGVITEDATQFTEFRVIVRQTTAWPARRVQLAVRYYMDLSDVQAMGFAPNPLDAIAVTLNYADGNGKATLTTGRFPSQDKTLYYFEVSWPAEAAPWPGGRGNQGSEYEAQVRISLRNSRRSPLWNRKSDYSYGRMGTGAAPADTDLLPLYSGGVVVFGREPPASPVSSIVTQVESSTSASAASMATATKPSTSSAAPPGSSSKTAVVTPSPSVTVTSRPASVRQSGSATSSQRATASTTARPSASVSPAPTGTHITAQCIWDDRQQTQLISFTARITNTGSNQIALDTASVQYFFGGSAASSLYRVSVASARIIPAAGQQVPADIAQGDLIATVTSYASGSAKYVATVTFRSGFLAAGARIVLSVAITPVSSGASLDRSSEYSRIASAVDAYVTCPSIVVSVGNTIVWGNAPQSFTISSQSVASVVGGSSAAATTIATSTTPASAPSSIALLFEPQSAGINSITYRVTVTNTGTASFALGSLSATYYFEGTADATATPTDYMADAYSAGVVTSGPPYHRDVTPAATASVTQAPGSRKSGARLAATIEFSSTTTDLRIESGASVRVQVGIHAKSWAALNKASDYSAQSSTGSNDRILVVVAGAIVSGTAPQ